MQVHKLDGLPPLRQGRTVLAIGKFDGVHIGHQAILHAAMVACPNTPVSVMTFYPHPAWALVAKPGYDRWLTPLSEQVRLLTARGVDTLYQVEFSRTYAETSAASFVRDHLARLNLERVVVGADFRFGQGGQADVHDLDRLCAEIGVPVTVVQAVEENGAKVSSSQIRQHLIAGRVEAAEALLGRPYLLEGVVEHGDKMGRQLGFPTANLGLTDLFVLPAGGVYAVSVEVLTHGEVLTGHWSGVMNVGWRPTVGGTTFRMEVHLLQFQRDIYGERLRVSLLRRVRDEQKFAGLDELKAQIALDVEQVQVMMGLSDADDHHTNPIQLP